MEKYIYKGKKCHSFSFETPEEGFQNLKTDCIQEYGESLIKEDGSSGHNYYVFDAGGRSLHKCKECGALFLIQNSVFHGEEDSFYVDWYQVGSREEADYLNTHYNGFALEKNYCGPYYKITNGKVTWRKEKGTE